MRLSADPRLDTNSINRREKNKNQKRGYIHTILTRGGNAGSRIDKLSPRPCAQFRRYCKFPAGTYFFSLLATLASLFLSLFFSFPACISDRGRRSISAIVSCHVTPAVVDGFPPGGGEGGGERGKEGEREEKGKEKERACVI